MLYIKGDQSNIENISIFNIKGEVVLKDDNINLQTINVSDLPQGVYVIRVNGQAIKFVK